MWYWTNFLMQLMARAGLATAVIFWVVSQWGPVYSDAKVHPVHIRIETNETAVAVRWRPSWAHTSMPPEILAMKPIH